MGEKHAPRGSTRGVVMFAAAAARPLRGRMLSSSVAVLVAAWMIFAIAAVAAVQDDRCSEQCSCVPAMDAAAAAVATDSSAAAAGTRITCRGNAGTSLGELQPQDWPEDAVELDISGFHLENITRMDFQDLPLLQKLVLRNNRIQWIESGAFVNLTQLQTLHLGHNQLQILNSSMFEGLRALETLNLAGNKIRRLDEGVFTHLQSLTTIDLSGNLLMCDCHLRWINKWSRKKRIIFAPNTVCHGPPKMKGKNLKQIKRKDFHCDWPEEPLALEMSPAVNQVVFQGDQLKFRCNVTNMERTELVWFHNGKEITLKTNQSNPVINDSKGFVDGSTLVSTLLVSPLKSEHTGLWGCQARMAKINQTRNISILVISNDVRHCVQTVTVNNKGHYMWPKTVIGITAELPCESQQPTKPQSIAYASYTCNNRGVWENLDTRSCPYVSEVTKVLEQFSKTNLSINSRAAVVESAFRLRNYTGDGSILRDKMDVVFVSRTIENYLEYVPWQKEIGEVLIDVISSIMRVDKTLLSEAQKEDRACSRLVQAIEKLPDLMTDSSFNRYRDNIAVEEFLIKPNSFSGISCTSYVRAVGVNSRKVDMSYNEKVFECNTVDIGNIRDSVHNKVIEASIQLPASLFQQLELPTADMLGTQKLQFTIYRNSKLFPMVNHVNLKQNEIITSIISSQLVKLAATNLTDPVIIRLRTPIQTDVIIPVWWDFTANDNYGDWSNEGCKIQKVLDNLVVFQCDRLANFGLLQDADEVASYYSRKEKPVPRSSHPAIYVGSFVCIVCLSTVILTYLCFCRSIKMPKKAIHSLVNTWVALTLLCFLFCIGIYQTQHRQLCQAVGILLHYFTLCSLMWMMITISNMYKKLTKHDIPDLTSEEPLPPKPMLRFYLAGWGIAIIICGISTAVNMEEYAGYNYCFLAFGPSLGALYGPIGALIFFLCIFLCLVHCVISSLDTSSERRNPSAGDLDMMTMVEHPPVEVHSVISSNIDDLEHPAILQLRAHAVVLLLFLLTWASAAIATGQPFAEHFSHEEAIFSYIYGCLSSVLGIFVFTFFCYSRQDVRACWNRLGRCRRGCEIYDTGLSAPALARSNGHIQQSTHSLESSFTNKSSHTSRSHEGGMAKGCVAGFASNSGINTNVVPMTENQLSGAEIFYNPRQNGIAKRFFEKNRQQQLKLNQNKNIAKSNQNHSRVSGSTSEDLCSQSGKQNGIKLFGVEMFSSNGVISEGKLSQSANIDSLRDNDNTYTEKNDNEVLVDNKEVGVNGNGELNSRQLPQFDFNKFSANNILSACISLKEKPHAGMDNRTRLKRSKKRKRLSETYDRSSHIENSDRSCVDSMVMDSNRTSFEVTQSPTNSVNLPSLEPAVSEINQNFADGMSENVNLIKGNVSDCASSTGSHSDKTLEMTKEDIANPECPLWLRRDDSGTLKKETSV